MTAEKPKRPKRKKREDDEDMDDYAPLVYAKTYDQRLQAGWKLMRGNPDWSE